MKDKQENNQYTTNQSKINQKTTQEMTNDENRSNEDYINPYPMCVWKLMSRFERHFYKTYYDPNPYIKALHQGKKRKQIRFA